MILFLGALGVAAAYKNIFPVGSSFFSSLFFFYAGFHSTEIYWGEVYDLRGLGIILILLGLFMFVNGFFVVYDVIFKEDQKRGVLNG